MCLAWKAVHYSNPGVLLVNILLKHFNEQRSSTIENSLGAPGQRWGSELPSFGPLGSPMHIISKKLAKQENRARFPASE